ncbi:hypothetical protein [Bradyrhizobium sp. RDI18]|uniref:hypothetical protein n=1 Tax=Bradyrhizobium sp. RDI18 TaxID=3367400 RepID=UPI003711EFB9
MQAGMEAANLMVQWQRDFVDWWNANVGVRQRANSKVNADLRSPLSRDMAEEETRISQQQVSRWRNGLKRSDYPIRIFNAAYKKAMADKQRRGHRP